jgi:REP element-mobilizing transposase RayT
MTRLARASLVGELHHVYARGAARQNVFVDAHDRRRYLALLSRVTRRMSWSCLTYCLMGNHMHLLVETGVPALSSGMQRLHGEYAQTFNRRHALSGHVFQRRFEARPVTSDEQLWATVAYIVNNPVKDGFCERPEAWPWSSHAAILDGTAPPWLDEPRLFAYLAAHGGDPRVTYAELVKGARPL